MWVQNPLWLLTIRSFLLQAIFSLFFMILNPWSDTQREINLHLTSSCCEQLLASQGVRVKSFGRNARSKDVKSSETFACMWVQNPSWHAKKGGCLKFGDNFHLLDNLHKKHLPTTLVSECFLFIFHKGDFKKINLRQPLRLMTKFTFNRLLRINNR